ncbi:hypothetical protein A6R68_11649 [Neotoma lepida]|uniref:Uncharacterized protein n=1 Tax=Neotoma lepida TaxID=56216 RepID=A0A1A6FVS3_NEOLE|nr:hypothetical protein A6R68_11649 [Neotoma lepida]
MASENFMCLTSENAEIPDDFVELQLLNVEEVSVETSATQTVDDVGVDWAHGGHYCSPPTPLQPPPDNTLSNGDHDQETVVLQTQEEGIGYQDSDNLLFGAEFESQIVLPALNEDDYLQLTTASFPDFMVEEDGQGELSPYEGDLCSLATLIEASAEEGEQRKLWKEQKRRKRRKEQKRRKRQKEQKRWKQWKEQKRWKRRKEQKRQKEREQQKQRKSRLTTHLLIIPNI